MNRDAATRWSIIILLCTLLGFFFASETFFAFALDGRPITWRQALLYELTGWYTWALLAPAIVLLAQRIPFERGRWGFAAVFHLTASALFSVLQLILKITFTRWLQPASAQSFSDSFRFVLESGSYFNLVAYWGVLAASYGLVFYRKSQERDLRASQLEARLAQARLQVLEMELQPHFLFNTLNTVSALVHKDPDTAERMIARLGDLLRLTLHNSGQQEVTLQEELELLDRYVEIEQTRFRDRLRFQLTIADDTLRARVPRLLLQPIVENAIRHGISRRSSAGRVEVHARRTANSLLLRVSDDGPGLPTEQNGREGIGLGNTRARLQELYPNRHRFQLDDEPGGGVAVLVELPYHTSTDDER
jgi:sensor histidine kinase YesM